MAFFDSVDTCITDLGIRLGINYTDEQREFIKDFTVPTISFSSPGTGKTKSAISGLILAETFHQIPGRNIYAVSFTNMATGELKARHRRDCARIGIQQTVNFSTIHSLCLGVLKKEYHLLGMDSFSSNKEIPLDTRINILLNVAEAYHFELVPKQCREIINACNALNSKLVFDDDHVRDSYEFKQTRVDFNEFRIYRRALYQLAKNMNLISSDDIMLYTLELFITHPEISEEFKKQCRVLLVDEFQDLSLLELRVITMLSDCVIAIGDIKQQIFAFQGACPDVVEEYHKYFPTARTANLNKSFRCAEEIVDFSKGIIAPNNMGEHDFVGMGKHGEVDVIPSINLHELVTSIESEYRVNKNTFTKDIMFLFRNNYSAMPIAEEFFQARVPFRVNNYVAASYMPVIRDFISIIELAANPQSPDNVRGLFYILPEMKEYRQYTESPIYKIMCKEGCSFFEVEYNYRNAMQARCAVELLFKVRELLQASAPMRDILNVIYPVYNEVHLSRYEPYLPMPSQYYISMVQPLVRTKTYFQFAQDEVAKVQAIADANTRGIGVRCYTFHAAKGLEADVVYMLDCSDGVCPGMRHLDRMEAMGCAVEKARDIRNERSLLFVAATRAKEKLVVSYNGEMSPLLNTNYNVFQQYDTLYSEHRLVYNDAEAFVDFIHFSPSPDKKE